MTDSNTRCFPSLEAMRTVHRALLAEHRTLGEDEALLNRVESFIQRGVATGAVLDAEDEREAAQALLDYWSSILYRAERTPPEAILADFDASSQPELDDAECPYIGLDTFGRERGDRFYGRDEVVDELVALLRDKARIIVTGRSGSGASSTVLGGLLPALQAGRLPGSEDWDYLPPFRPGPHPLTQLARCLLGPGASPQELAAYAGDLKVDPRRLAQGIAQRSSGTPVLVVDELDELFTHCPDSEERQAFVANLVHYAGDQGAAVRLILILKPAYEDFLKRYPPLDGWYQDDRFRIPPLTAQDIRKAILEPARKVGLRFDEHVVNALVQDILGEPGAPALLQFTLLQLWEHRDHSRITWEVYKRVGGGRNALTRVAEDVFARMSPQEREICRYIFLRLVVLGAPGLGPAAADPVYCRTIARRMSRRSLFDGQHEPATLEAVLESLSRARLIRVIGDGDAEGAEVQVAHPALFENWQRLEGWLDEERGYLRIRARYNQKAREWVRLGRGEDGLLSAAEIAEARDWLSSAEAGRLGYEDALPELVERSEDAIEERQRHEIGQARRLARIRRKWRNVFAATTVVALVFAMLFFWQQRQTQHLAASWECAAQRLAGRMDLAANLIASANEAEAKGNVARAQDLRRQALQYIRTVAEKARENQRRLASGDDIDYCRQSDANLYYTVSSPAEKMWGVAIDPGGQRFATADDDGHARIWKLDSGYPVGDSLLGDEAGLLNAVAYHPVLPILATAGQSGRIRLWDLSTDEPRPQACVMDAGGRVYDLAFSHDEGRLIAAATDQDQALVWDWRKDCGTPIARFPHDDDVFGVAFDSTGTRLASAGGDGRVKVWDLSTRELLRVLTGHKGPVFSVSFSPQNDRRLLTAGMDKTARIWDWEARSTIAVLDRHKDILGKAVYSPDGGRIATTSADTLVRLWDGHSGAFERALEGHRSPIFGAAFGPHGEWLVTTGFDATAIVWHLTGGH